MVELGHFSSCPVSMSCQHVLWVVGERMVGGFPSKASGVSRAGSQPPPGAVVNRLIGTPCWGGGLCSSSVCSLGYFHVRTAGYILGVSEHWGDTENLGIFEI